MARALFLLVIGFLGNLVLSAEAPEEQLKSTGVAVRDPKSRNGDITNLDSIFPGDDKKLLKAAKGKSGKDKDKKKKKKKHRSSPSSSSSDDDRRSRKDEERRSGRGSVPAPNPEDQRVRQQEIGRHGSRHVSREENEFVGDDGVITVRGPIRRKPIVFNNDS